MISFYLRHRRPLTVLAAVIIIVVIANAALPLFSRADTATAPSATQTHKSNQGLVQALSAIHLTLSNHPTTISPADQNTIYARAFIVLDRATKYPLAAKNADTEYPIASTTKIMTALLTLESEPLDKVVTVPNWITTIPPDVIGLVPGEKITVNDLLYGMLLNSGNDAANTLAVADGGTVDDFVARMNKRAAELGLTHTHYLDPAGLNDGGHSSAHDLAILTDYALNNSTFAKIVSTPSATVYSTDGEIAHPLTNSNRLIQPTEPLYYPYAIGVKTGLTDGAGHVLIAAAQWQDHSAIAVVLHTDADTADASANEARKLLVLAAQTYTR